MRRRRKRRRARRRSTLRGGSWLFPEGVAELHRRKNSTRGECRNGRARPAAPAKERRLLAGLESGVFRQVALALPRVHPQLLAVLDQPEHVLVALFFPVALVDDVVDTAVIELLCIEQPVDAEIILPRLRHRLELGDALERAIAVLLGGKLVAGFVLLLEALPDVKAPAVVAAVGAEIVDCHLPLGKLELLGGSRGRERRDRGQAGRDQQSLEQVHHVLLWMTIEVGAICILR